MPAIDHIEIRYRAPEEQRSMPARKVIVKHTVDLMRNLAQLGSCRRRLVLYTMALYTARSTGRVAASWRTLQHSAEMGHEALLHFIGELERDGWVRRDGGDLFLNIKKLEANQVRWEGCRGSS